MVLVFGSDEWGLNDVQVRSCHCYWGISTGTEKIHTMVKRIVLIVLTDGDVIYWLGVIFMPGHVYWLPLQSYEAPTFFFFIIIIIWSQMSEIAPFMVSPFLSLLKQAFVSFVISLFTIKKYIYTYRCSTRAQSWWCWDLPHTRSAGLSGDELCLCSQTRTHFHSRARKHGFCRWATGHPS